MNGKILITTGIFLIALFFSANIAPAQTESENAEAIAKINEALKKQTALISNLMNQPQTTDGLTREKVREIIKKEAVEYMGPTHKMFVRALLTVAFQGTDLEGREEAVENEYFRLLKVKKTKEGNEFLLKCVAVAMAKKDGERTVSKELSSPSLAPSKDYDGEIRKLEKEIADLADSQKNDRDYFDLYFRDVVGRLDGIDETIKTATETVKDTFTKYGDELEDLKSEVAKKAGKDEIPAAVEGLRVETGAALWTLVDGLKNIGAINKDGKALKTKTVIGVGAIATVLGRGEPVELTDDGKKALAEEVVRLTERLKKWDKYKPREEENRGGKKK